MLFKTHIVFSLAVYFILSNFIEMPTFVLGFVLLSTVFVDIDIKNSKFGNHWYFRPLQWITKHRGFLHSLIFAILSSLVIGSLNLWAGFGFFVGYISHLFLDCWTKSGIRLFWPFKWKIKGFIKSGGIIEDVVFVLLLLENVLLIGICVFEMVA